MRYMRNKRALLKPEDYKAQTEIEIPDFLKKKEESKFMQKICYGISGSVITILGITAIKKIIKTANM